MRINDREVVGDKFAYDGCHKIYLLEDQTDVDEARRTGYTICQISELEELWEGSCSLRFISNWALTVHYVAQFEDATFEI